jgi:hypothetical protein
LQSYAARCRRPWRSRNTNIPLPCRRASRRRTKVETRLGTLRFFDGFPDNATEERLYDNLDFQRAVQAYLLALPPVSQVANRKAILELGPANATLPIFEQLMIPSQ